MQRVFWHHYDALPLASFLSVHCAYLPHSTLLFSLKFGLEVEGPILRGLSQVEEGFV